MNKKLLTTIISSERGVWRGIDPHKKIIYFKAPKSGPDIK